MVLKCWGFAEYHVECWIFKAHHSEVWIDSVCLSESQDTCFTVAQSRMTPSPEQMELSCVLAFGFHGPKPFNRFSELAGVMLQLCHLKHQANVVRTTKAQILAQVRCFEWLSRFHENGHVKDDGLLGDPGLSRQILQNVQRIIKRPRSM